MMQDDTQSDEAQWQTYRKGDLPALFAPLSFAIVIEGHPKVYNKPHIDTPARANIALSSAVFEALRRPGRVVLLRDVSRNLIGIRSATSDERGSLKVRGGEKGSPYKVSALGFLRHFDLVQFDRITGDLIDFTPRAYLGHIEHGIAVFDLGGTQ